MKVLVTGGTGFTGSALVRRLLSRNHEVHVLDNQKGIAYDELVSKGARVEIGSITDSDLLRRIVPGCEIIHHLAAAFRKVNLPKRVYWDTNVTAMQSLLEIARASNVRKFIYCSTQGVHGNIENPPGDETSPIKPEDYYQFTKHEGEKVARKFIQEGMDITILRPTALYGPGDPGRFLMMFRQVKKGYFPFFGGGHALYHPVYVENFVDAFEQAVDTAASRGQTYIIADRDYFEIREIVLKISRIMGVNLKVIALPFWPLYALAAMVEFAFLPLPWDPPIFRRRADWFRQNRAFKIDKARRELGYTAKIGLEDGLQQTYDWYKNNGYL
jgi:nucleoside-diphosphate-sugar epimerase